MADLMFQTPPALGAGGRDAVAVALALQVYGPAVLRRFYERIAAAILAFPQSGQSRGRPCVSSRPYIFPH